MNGFYKVKGPYFDQDKEYCGVVVGEDEADLMRKVVEYYDKPVQITFWFGENFDQDVIELEDFKECPLFDFK